MGMPKAVMFFGYALKREEDRKIYDIYYDVGFEERHTYCSHDRVQIYSMHDYDTVMCIALADTFRSTGWGPTVMHQPSDALTDVSALKHRLDLYLKEADLPIPDQTPNWYLAAEDVG